MKKFIIVFFILSLCIKFASAQERLNINKAFSINDPSKTETFITGKSLESSELSLFHSISFPATESNLKITLTAIKKDSHDIVDKEVVYKEGQLSFGFYSYTQFGNKNRYLCFTNMNNRIKLIYLEGKASKIFIKKMSTKK